MRWRSWKKGANEGFRLDSHHPTVIQPDALKDELQQLALGFRIGPCAPEDPEVVEHPARLVEVGDRLGRKLGQFSVDGIAAGEVFRAVEVAELMNERLVAGVARRVAQ